jgi:hypothetical protein
MTKRRTVIPQQTSFLTDEPSQHTLPSPLLKPPPVKALFTVHEEASALEESQNTQRLTVRKARLSDTKE